MRLTFNIIREENTLTFDAVDYVKDTDNPYVFICASPITRIGNWVFYGCQTLTQIVIPESVTSIGVSAFCNCQSLTKIVIPNSVTFIDFWAFNLCPSLTRVETNSADIYIIEYFKKYYSGIDVIVTNGSYILK